MTLGAGSTSPTLWACQRDGNWHSVGLCPRETLLAAGSTHGVTVRAAQAPGPLCLTQCLAYSSIIEGVTLAVLTL